jgi:Cd(II)/Pb(II)-responsive transcriptional regulator
MHIGELAQRTGVPVETIRYYERVGLVARPARRTNNYREYSTPHAERLRFIVNCRVLDMSIDEIRALLRVADHPSGSCADANATIEQHLAHVRRHLNDLRRLERQLRELQRRCAAPGQAQACGILGRLRETATGRRRARSGVHSR